MNGRCSVYWGSHGCDLPEGHDGPHLCGSADKPCSQHDGVDRSRDYDDEAEVWAEWHPARTY